MQQHAFVIAASMASIPWSASHDCSSCDCSVRAFCIWRGIQCQCMWHDGRQQHIVQLEQLAIATKPHSNASMPSYLGMKLDATPVATSQLTTMANCLPRGLSATSPKHCCVTSRQKIPRVRRRWAPTCAMHRKSAGDEAS